MKNYLILLGCLLIVNNAFNQDEDESCTMPDKKVMKLVKAAESPKIDFRERSQLYLEAIELDDEKAFTVFAYAEYLFDRAQKKYEDYKRGMANYAIVKNQFNAVESKYQTVIDLCPEFNATTYYKLGFINFYIQNDKESGKSYFKQFLSYHSDDPNRYPEEYVELKSGVTRLLEELEKEESYAKAFYDNPVPYDPVMVRNVSTEKDEYLPMISPDNELIFYTRRGDERNLGDFHTNLKEVFSVSQRPNVLTDFNRGNPLVRPFNTDEFDNYGGISLSIDNKEMFICACKVEDVQGQPFKNCDIYVTYFKRSGKGGYDYVWTDLENLGSNINTNTGWEAQPTLSADGNTLYFSAFRKNTKLTDIYYSERQKDGSWSLAKPVPGPINTDGHDKSPFLHQDSETMYFVSQVSETRTGAGEPGNFDVFYSRKDENGNWAEPKNLGYPINSADNELGLIVSTDGKLAYIASDKGESNSSEGGGVDLYYFELYEAAQPQKVLFVKGEVKDEEGDPIKDAKVEIQYNEKGESVEVNINGDDGKFAAVIEVDEPQDVLVSVKKKGFSFDTQIITKEEIDHRKTADETFRKESFSMEIDELEVGKSFTINNILFATDSYELSKRSKFVLNQFISFLKENPDITVTIEGHTDDVGDNNKNLTLSKNRANSAMNYIVSQGISESRLKAIGYGETRPKVPNTSSSNRSKNRRTDFKLTGGI